ncbi:MAG: Gfo/Idh/MocA family oxidoreductase [Clostridiales bacterium]|nr:Gfo/Idh/MocA family oxidoreductase [Clostridiales bacterium]
MADAVLSQFKQQEEKEVISSDKKLKIGIIGTGWIAESHAESYLIMPDVEIVALSDIIPGKAQKFAKKYGLENVKFYGHHSEMINDKSLELDAVSVCTYNKTHAECTIDSLKRGWHVLLEKPMCVTIEEAVAIRKAEKETGKVLSIGFQPRFDVNMQMIKKIVESGELGEVYYIQTGGGRRRGIPGGTFIEQDTAGIGALADIGCYSLDMVLNAIGYPKPLTVSAYKSDFFGKNPEMYPEDSKRFNVDDFAAAFIRLEGGIILDFRISWAMHMDTAGDTLILGKKAGLRIPSTECWNGTVGGPMKIYRDVANEPVCYEVPILPDYSGMGLFDKKIRSFLDAVKNGTKAPVSTDQIFYNQAILSGIVKSAELGKEIELDLPDIG